MLQLPPLTTPAVLAGALSRGEWQQARHLTLLSDHLVAAATGRIPRLQINMPPRHGKTLLTIRYFSVWYLLAWPKAKLLYAAKSEDAAAEESEAIRDLIDEWGPAFGLAVRISKRSAHNWQLVDQDGRPTGGGMRALGRCSATHGRGANAVLLDDLFGSMSDVTSAANRENVWRWLTSSVRSRLTPGGIIVSIGTPLHPDDHFGRFEEAEQLGGDKWVRLRLPALAAGGVDPLGRAEGEARWPEMFPRAHLLATREHLLASGNIRDWNAQYDLEPQSGDGLSEFPKEWLPTSLYFTDWPSDPVYGLISVDPSQGRTSKADYFAIAAIEVTYNAANLPTYWVDVDAERRPVPVGEDAVVAQALVRRPRQVIVESNNDQHEVAANIAKKLQAACRLMKIPPIQVAGKEATDGGGKHKPRIKITLGPLLKAGQIRVKFGPGGRLLMQQLRDYPYAAHDDCPDALEQGIAVIRSLGL